MPEQAGVSPRAMRMFESARARYFTDLETERSMESLLLTAQSLEYTLGEDCAVYVDWLLFATI